MSAIKSKPIFEECFLAFKCTFPKDHITLECWRRAACVLEDVTALTTTGRNHSGRDFTAPVFCLLSIQRIVPCASACVSCCAFSVLLCIGQRSQGVCAAQPQCCWKTFINDLLLLRKAQLYYFPGRNQIWAEETVWRRCHRLFPLQRGGSRPVATSAFSLFAFCSAFHCLLCHLSTFYLAACSTVHSVNFFHKQMNWTPLFAQSLFPPSQQFLRKGQFKIPKVCNKTV